MRKQSARSMENNLCAPARWHWRRYVTLHPNYYVRVCAVGANAIRKLSAPVPTSVPFARACLFIVGTYGVFSLVYETLRIICIFHYFFFISKHFPRKFIGLSRYGNALPLQMYVYCALKDGAGFASRIITRNGKSG
jgi:hypothetical protein